MTKKMSDAVFKVNSKILSKKYKMIDMPCVCCSSHNEKIVFQSDKCGFKQKTVICKDCGFLYLNPRLDQKSLDNFYEARHYEEIFTPKIIHYRNKWERSLYFKRKEFNNKIEYDPFDFINFIEDTGIKYNSVFEIGSAGGANLRIFKSLKKKVAGCEPNKNLRRFANSKKINVKPANSRNILPNYDLYILQHVFEHLYDPINLLKLLKKKKAKYLYIGVPGIINQLPSIQIAHNFYFSKKTLTKICLDAGFKLVDINSYKRNDYIVAIFENKKCSEFNYDRSEEFKNSMKIINRYKVVSTVHNCLEFIKKVRT